MAGNGKPKLSVFTGREAKLNRAIFKVLAKEGILTVYEICKKVRTHKSLKYTKYSVINRRVRNLVDLEYIETAGERETQAGFKAQQYQLTQRAYLAIAFEALDFNTLIQSADETELTILLVDILSILKNYNN